MTYVYQAFGMQTGHHVEDMTEDQLLDLLHRVQAADPDYGSLNITWLPLERAIEHAHQAIEGSQSSKDHSAARLRTLESLR